MSFLGLHLYPDLLEESWRELERERRRDRRIEKRRSARRAGRPSRFAALAARRHPPQIGTRRSLAAGC